MVRTTSSLLACGPLGVWRWAGRPSHHSLVRRPQGSSGLDTLTTACAGCSFHGRQAVRAPEPVQTRCDACLASFLMKLSHRPCGGAVRRPRGDGCSRCPCPPNASPALSGATTNWYYRCNYWRPLWRTLAALGTRFQWQCHRMTSDVTTSDVTSVERREQTTAVELSLPVVTISTLCT